MNWSELNTELIQHKVQSMYRFETTLVNRLDLLTNSEMQEFYQSYCYL